MYWFKPLTFACHRIPEKKRTHQGYNKRLRDLDVSVFSRYGLIKQSKEALSAHNCRLGQYPSSHSIYYPNKTNTCLQPLFFS